MHDQTKEIENDNSLPISSLYKNKAYGNLDQEMDASVDRGAGKLKPRIKYYLPLRLITDKVKSKRRKGKNGLRTGCFRLLLMLIITILLICYLRQKNEHIKQHAANEDVSISDNAALPSVETDPKKSRTKRKKKEQVNKSDNGYHEDIIQEDKANREAVESQNLVLNDFEEKEQHQKLTNKKSVDNSAHDFLDGNQSDDRKVKKRKKMSKSQGNGDVVNSDMPVSVEQSGVTEMMEDDRNKRKDAKPSQVRPLPNGLVIQ